MSEGGLAVLLRLSKGWHDGMSAGDLYESTRKWWVMAPANAERVERVLAVADGIVREVYQPARWLPSPVEGLENRIGFEGAVAPDREMYVGRDVSSLFRQGSANPVRYLPLGMLAGEPASMLCLAPGAGPARAGETAGGPGEPGLLERIVPLVEAFGKDLLWAQSLAGQELFHSNTIAWLAENYPAACAPRILPSRCPARSPGRGSALSHGLPDQAVPDPTARATDGHTGAGPTGLRAGPWLVPPCARSRPSGRCPCPSFPPQQDPRSAIRASRIHQGEPRWPSQNPIPATTTTRY